MCFEKGKEGKRTQKQTKKEIQKRLEAYLFLENQTGEMKAIWISNKKRKEKNLILLKKDGSYEDSSGSSSSPAMRVKMARVWLKDTNEDEKWGWDTPLL